MCCVSSLPWSECRRIALVSQKHNVVDSQSFLCETFLPSQCQRQHEGASGGNGPAWSWACCCTAGCDLLVNAANCLTVLCHQHHRCSYTGMKANSLDLSLQCCWFFSVELPEPVLQLHLVLWDNRWRFTRTSTDSLHKCYLPIFCCLCLVQSWFALENIWRWHIGAEFQTQF